MQTGRVSFGSVIALYGTRNAVEKFDRRIFPPETVSKDVTAYFYSSDGKIGEAARKHGVAELYITGRKDLMRIKNQEKGWDTIDGLVSQMILGINADRETTASAARKVKRVMAFDEEA